MRTTKTNPDAMLARAPNARSRIDLLPRARQHVFLNLPRRTAPQKPTPRHNPARPRKSKPPHVIPSPAGYLAIWLLGVPPRTARRRESKPPRQSVATKRYSLLQLFKRQSAPMHEPDA